MKYLSTRGGAEFLGFEDVLLAGLARDGGLFVPEIWPQLADLSAFANLSFAEIAAEVIAPFAEGEISKQELRRMAEDAYASFDVAEVTPLRQLSPHLTILELFHGPTLAFKDVAMQLLARLIDHVLTKRGARATIVGATSGDTGGAAIEAFRSSSRVDVFILYPQGRVSDVQRRMMTTPKEENVHAIAIEGSFDDCQALVKAMFNDHRFRDAVELSGVNSINWGRIVAQITYYVWVASRLHADKRHLTFAVPTGNFGDIFAGYAAKRMGLDIAKLIIGSNANDILPRTVETGVYEMRDVVATSSPSMDIQISSNFERYLFEASGRDSAFIRTAMTALAQDKKFALRHVWPKLQADFAAASSSEFETAECIRATKARYDYVIDPHTACAVVAAQRCAPDKAAVVLSTAHPAKFPDAIESITNVRPALPSRLAHLLSDAERLVTLPNNLTAVQIFVKERCRANAGAVR